MKMYKFVWHDGKIDTGPGNDAADAFTRLGFGAGAAAALDHHEEINEPIDNDWVCPKCGPVNQISILVNTWVNAGIIDSGMEGAELKGDVEWCGFDKAECIKCGYTGLVRDFRTQ